MVKGSRAAYGRRFPAGKGFSLTGSGGIPDVPAERRDPLLPGAAPSRPGSPEPGFLEPVNTLIRELEMQRTRRHIPHIRHRRARLYHTGTTVFERPGAGIIHLDQSLRITGANPPAAAMLRVSPASLKGRSLEDLFPHPLPGRLSRGFLGARRKRSPIHLEASLPGSAHPRVRFRCVSAGAGFALVLEDVPVPSGEIDIRQAFGTYGRTLFDAVNDAIFIHDAETGAILDVNRKTSEIFGYTAHEARGLTLGHISSGIPPYTREKAMEKVRGVEQAGELLFEWQARNKAGGTFWAEVNLKKTFVNGKLCLVSVVRDITKRKEAQDALEESRRFLSSLMSNLPGMAYRRANDPQWTMEFTSEGCADLTGYAPEDLVNNRRIAYASLIHPDDRARVRREIRHAIVRRRPFRLVYRITTASSGQKWVWEQGRAVRSPEGEVEALEGLIIDFTERIEVEERLRQSEERLKLAQRAGRVGVFDWDVARRTGVFTDELKDLLGLPQEHEPTEKTWELVTHPDDHNRIRALIEQAITEKRPSIHFESRIVRPDGQVLWLMNHGLVHYDRAGNPLRMIGTSVNVTEIKEIQHRLESTNERLELTVRERTRALDRMVEELRQQKEVLLTVLDHIPVMLVFFDPQGRVRYINREMEKISEWPLEQVRDSDFIAKAFPDEAPREEVRRVLRGEKPEWHGLEITTRSGGTHPGLWTHATLSDGSSIGIGIDVSARRKMERDLQRLAAAIEQVGEGIVLLSPERVIEYVNPAYERISGYSREELTGQVMDRRGGFIGEPLACKEFSEAMAGGRPWSVHQSLQKKSGEAVDVYLAVSPVRDREGRIIHYVSVARDVTRETALVQQIIQSQKLEAIGTLAGGIAHDLKNIFTPIVLNAEIALMDLKPGHPLRPLLEEIQEAARMGSDLTRQIVLFSRKDFREKRAVPITPIIEEALAFLRSALPATIQIRTALQAPKASVQADPTQIKQVMINLGNNASHAMRSGGGLLEVAMSTEHLGAKAASGISPDLAPGRYVRISVRDTGEGMDEAVLSRVFDPFFTTKNKSEGTGMGLSVVHGIVKDHQGAVTVQSRPGQGSTFTVYLPRIKTRARGTDAPLRGRHGQTPA